MFTSKLLPFVAGAAALFSFNLNAATTDPVGVISMTFKANSDTAFSVPLHRAAEFSGVIAEDGVDGFTLTAEGTPGWEADEFIEAPYYVLMMDGPMEGMYYSVLDNDEGELTVEDIGAGDLATQGIAAGQQFQVIPFWTLNTLFPNGEGVVATSDVGSPQCLVMIPNVSLAGVNLPLGDGFFYHDGSQGPEGWYKNGAIGEGLQNDYPLANDNFYVVRNLTGSDSDFVLAGSVQMANHKSILVRIENGLRQDNYVGFTFPVSTTLDESGLSTSDGFSSSPNVGQPQDILLVYDNLSSGINKPAGLGYFYHDGSQGPEGWYIEGNIGAGIQDDVEVFTPGSAYIIRKSEGSASSGFWTAEPSYVAN